MASVFIQDLLSVIDHTLYSIKPTGTNTNTTYNFFDETEQMVGKQRSNLTIPNQLSRNWIKFTVYGIGIRFFNALNVSGLMQFFRDSYYVFKVSDHELKFGHLSEFLHSNAYVYKDYTATEGTTSTTIRTLNWVGEGNGIYNGLLTGLEIVIPSGVSFVFSITCTSDITSMQNVNLGVFLKGKLERAITG